MDTKIRIVNDDVSPPKAHIEPDAAAPVLWAEAAVILAVALGIVGTILYLIGW
jgi:hypothetical protein